MYSSYSAAYRREPARVHAPSLLIAIAARPKLLFLVTAAVFGLFTVLTLCLPKGYVSHMKLRLGPEEEAYLPGASGTKITTDERANSLDGRMKLETEVLQSSDTLTQVVLKTGLQKLEAAEDGADDETTTLTIEKAVQHLQQRLKVERAGQSNLLQVTYSGPTPAIAAAALGNLAALYPKARIKVYGDSGHYGYLHSQSSVWRQQLEEAENNLVHFRRRYSEFVLPEERDALGKRTVEAQAAFEQADAQVAQYKKKVAEARDKLKALSPAKADQNKALLKSEAVAHAVMQLVDLIGKRTDLDNTSRPDRQLQRDSDQSIYNAKMNLTRILSQSSKEKIEDLNPVHQNAEMTLIGSETDLAGLEALRNHLRRTADGYKQEMFRLAAAEVRDTALLRQVKQTEEQYLLYSKWQEQAITGEALAKESIMHFGVVERPTIPFEPATPNVPLDLGLFFVLSLCCGLATVLCAEYLTPTALRQYAAVKTIPASLEVI